MDLGERGSGAYTACFWPVPSIEFCSCWDRAFPAWSSWAGSLGGVGEAGLNLPDQLPTPPHLVSEENHWHLKEKHANLTSTPCQKAGWGEGGGEAPL